jgi:hypothetical protein
VEFGGAPYNPFVTVVDVCEGIWHALNVGALQVLCCIRNVTSDNGRQFCKKIMESGLQFISDLNNSFFSMQCWKKFSGTVPGKDSKKDRVRPTNDMNKIMSPVLFWNA